jgi:hypothetical protein
MCLQYVMKFEQEPSHHRDEDSLVCKKKKRVHWCKDTPTIFAIESSAPVCPSFSGLNLLLDAIATLEEQKAEAAAAEENTMGEPEKVQETTAAVETVMDGCCAVVANPTAEIQAPPAAAASPVVTYLDALNAPPPTCAEEAAQFPLPKKTRRWIKDPSKRKTRSWYHGSLGAASYYAMAKVYGSHVSVLKQAGSGSEVVIANNKKGELLLEYQVS